MNFTAESSDFLRASFVHGPDHVNRVMFWAVAVGVLEACPSDVVANALAAARLHDLQRVDDGECHIHGALAARLVEWRWADLVALYGTTSRTAIEAACILHCRPVPLDRRSPFFPVSALLRDADALDRFRFNSGPREEWLHFATTHSLLRHASALSKISGTGAQLFAEGLDILSHDSNISDLAITRIAGILRVSPPVS